MAWEISGRTLNKGREKIPRVRIVEIGQSDPRAEQNRAKGGSEVAKQANQTRALPRPVLDRRLSIMR